MEVPKYKLDDIVAIKSGKQIDGWDIYIQGRIIKATLVDLCEFGRQPEWNYVIESEDELNSVKEKDIIWKPQGN